MTELEKRTEWIEKHSKYNSIKDLIDANAFKVFGLTAGFLKILENMFKSIFETAVLCHIYDVALMNSNPDRYKKLIHEWTIDTELRHAAKQREETNGH